MARFPLPREVGSAIDDKEAAPERCHHDIQVQGSGEAVWHSPEYDHEDAEFFRSAWISAALAARIEEAWTLYGVD